MTIKPLDVGLNFDTAPGERAKENRLKINEIVAYLNKAAGAGSKGTGMITDLARILAELAIPYGDNPCVLHREYGCGACCAELIRTTCQGASEEQIIALRTRDPGSTEKNESL
jgi:hypothetical protein